MESPAGLGRTLAARRLPGLDGLRAVAVFLVIAAHAGVPGVSGHHGVLLFFVLSGFLITRLLLVEEDKTGGVSLRAFYARRTLRIFPAFYVYAALVLAYWWVAHQAINWPQAVSALFYVSNYYQAIHGDPNTALSQTWSLAIEEQFYLLWPGLFLLLGTLRRRLSVTLAVILAVWVIRAYYALVLQVPDGYIYEALHTRIDHLLIGCLLALALKSPKLFRYLEQVSRHWWQLLGTFALLAISMFLQGRLPRTYREVVGFSTDPVLIGLLILQVMALMPARYVAWLEWPWLRYLGRISYPLYLYQQIVIGAMEKRTRALPPVVSFALVVMTCVAVASASYFLIEKPALRWKRRFETVKGPA